MVQREVYVVGQNRPKQCLFCSTDLEGSPKVSPFPLEVQPRSQGHFPFCHWDGGKGPGVG